jgi:hypothetical protein
MEFDKDLFACTEYDCTSRYDLAHGYFDSQVGDSIERDLDAVMRCVNDKSFIYLVYFDPETGIRMWRCPLQGCDGIKIA